MNTMNDVEKRAYSIWEQEGRPEGRHQDHWNQAQNELGDEKVPFSQHSDMEKPQPEQGDKADKKILPMEKSLKQKKK